MTFHLRDLIRLFRALGNPADGQMLTYNATAERPEWSDAAAGITYNRITLTEDVVSDAANGRITIPGWAIDDLPFGLYAFQHNLRIENNGGSTTQVYVEIDESTSGAAYAQFSGIHHYSFNNTIASGQAYLNSSSGLRDNGTNELCMNANGVSVANGRYFYSNVREGLFWHNDVGDAYYDRDLRMALRSSASVVRLKAGSWFEYALIEAF